MRGKNITQSTDQTNANQSPQGFFQSLDTTSQKNIIDTILQELQVNQQHLNIVSEKEESNSLSKRED